MAPSREGVEEQIGWPENQHILDSFGELKGRNVAYRVLVSASQSIYQILENWMWKKFFIINM